MPLSRYGLSLYVKRKSKCLFTILALSNPISAVLINSNLNAALSQNADSLALSTDTTESLQRHMEAERKDLLAYGLYDAEVGEVVKEFCSFYRLKYL